MLMSHVLVSEDKGVGIWGSPGKNPALSLDWSVQKPMTPAMTHQQSVGCILDPAIHQVPLFQDVVDLKVHLLSMDGGRLHVLSNLAATRNASFFLSYPMGCIVLPQLLSHSFSDLGILSSTKLREYAAVGEVLAKKTMVDFAEVHVNKLDNPPLPLLLSALGLAKKYIVEPGP